MTADLYSDADRYDLVMGAVASDAMLAFYRRQVACHGEPVLELACGSGRLLVALARAGVDITGLDLSRPMLDLAARKAAAAGVAPPLVHADVRAFDLRRTFATILFPAQSIQHLHTRDDLEAALACVRRHLAGGGRFVVELFNPSLPLLTRDPATRHPLGRHVQDGRAVALAEQVRYDAATQVSDILWFFRDEATGEETTLALAMRQYFPQELDALLAYNGFVVEQRLGDLAEAAFTGASPKQILICRAR